MQVLFDMVGFGRSDKPEDGDYNTGYFTGVTLELMDDLGIQKACFVGHSMGALVAQWVLCYPIPKHSSGCHCTSARLLSVPFLASDSTPLGSISCKLTI